MPSLRPTDEAHAAAVRLRSVAPVLALAVPAALLVVGAVVSGAAGDDAALWFVAAAAPVTALVAVARDHVDVVPLLVSMAASAPLWSLLGVAIARRAIASAGRTRAVSMRAFWRPYLLCVGAWAAIAIVLMGVAR
jgi:hypothetical protein